MARNKADLYRLSNPHSTRSSQLGFVKTKEFTVGVGTWKSGKYVKVRASSIKDAMVQGRDYCGRYDEVVEVLLNGSRVWHVYEG
jgi:hypothetical protein